MPLPRYRVTERQVLMLLLTASVVAFAVAFLLVGYRQRSQRADFGSKPRVRLVPATAIAAPQSIAADFFDPSLMSLPSAHGFSQGMWQRRAAASTRAFEPVSQLALLTPPAAADLPPMLQPVALTDSLPATVERLPATMDELETAETEQVAVVTTQSTLRIGGRLEQRNIIQLPDVPTVHNDIAVPPTRVRIGVALDGHVRYATLERSCGREEIDAQGLELAQHIRFEPISSSDPAALTWGNVRIVWATTAP